MTPRHTSLREWEAYVLRSRTAHLYRIASDGKGGWVVTRPGSKERLRFPAVAEQAPTSNMGASAEGMKLAPLEDAQAKTNLSAAQVSSRPATSHAEQWDAAVRGSHPDFS